MDIRKEEEREWWNRFSGIMARQWEMTPWLNKILRKDLIDDYLSYLFVKDGLLLDVGCGNGWIARMFAQKGMRAVGIDFSQEQIKVAREAISEDLSKNIELKCCDVIELSNSGLNTKFDSIMINALLHHLSRQEIEEFASSLKELLKEDGKVYMYEPFAVKGYKKNSVTKGAYIILCNILACFYRATSFLGMITPGYERERRAGYTGSSPHEAALNLDDIVDIFSRNFIIESIRPFHSLSLSYGMHMVVLKKIPRFFFTIFTPLIYYLDLFLLRKCGWKSMTDDGQVLCAMKIKKVKDQPI